MRRLVVILTMLALASLACSLGMANNEKSAEEITNQPLVLLVAPVNASVYAEGVDVALHAVVQDSGAGVTRIEFRVDDVPVDEVTAAQAGGQPSLDGIVSWGAAGQSGHLITVEGFRADGSSLGVDDVSVQVVQAPGAQPVQPAAETSPDEAGPSTEETAPPAEQAAPADSAAPPPAGGGGGPVARVNVGNLNVRQGPGTTYPTVGTLAQGEAPDIVGRNEDSTWWAISFGGGTAWVFSDLVTVEGDVSQVPLVAAP
jgi:hypothetical protein